MLKMLLLVMAAGGFTILWEPTGIKLEMSVYVEFKKTIKALPEKDKPQSNQENTCLWATYLMKNALFGPSWAKGADAAATAKNIANQARDYIKDHCGGGSGGAQALDLNARKRIWRTSLKWFLERTTAMPFELSPLPDRAGDDLGETLRPMFLALEQRLAEGGHRLTGEARACAWASAALSGANAVQRSPGATEGIGAGVKVLDGRVALHCKGDALAQKEAAWNWLRATPAATQPLTVAHRPPAPAWPAPTPADGALWLGTALLFLGPEAWPAILITSPAAR